MSNNASSNRLGSHPAQAGNQSAINDTVLDSMFFHGEAAIMSRRPTRLSMELLNRARERAESSAEIAECLHMDEAAREDGAAGGSLAR